MIEIMFLNEIKSKQALYDNSFCSGYPSVAKYVFLLGETDCHSPMLDENEQKKLYTASLSSAKLKGKARVCEYIDDCCKVFGIKSFKDLNTSKKPIVVSVEKDVFGKIKSINTPRGSITPNHVQLASHNENEQ